MDLRLKYKGKQLSVGDNNHGCSITREIIGGVIGN